MKGMIGAVYIIWDVIWAINYPNCADIFGAVVECIYSIGVVATIVCVEFCLDREAAGWMEKKGYPENYVHEYQKNNFFIGEIN